MSKKHELKPDHVADLKKSGLSDEMIQEAGIKSISGRRARLLLGGGSSRIESAMIFPYENQDHLRMKVFPEYRDRKGRKVRYLQPKDSGVHLYFPPGLEKKLRDAGVPLYITEGEKKALRAAQDGLCCIGLAGIWNWKEKGSGEVIEDLKTLPLYQRQVFIVPDSDIGSNSSVRSAVEQFWKALERRHAHVNVIPLPAGETGKMGLDDYLVNHSLGQFMELPKVQRRADLPNSPAIYKRDDGVLWPVSFGRLHEPPAAEPVMGGIIAKNHSTTIYGDGGQGKSLIAMAIGLAFARGKKFLGHPLAKGRVLYLDWELSQEEQLRRAFQLSRGEGYSKPPKRFMYLTPRDFIAELVPKLKKLLEKREHVLIVFDSMGPACGVSPEAADEITRVFSEIKTLGVSCLLVDHQSKLQEGQRVANKTPFGSAYKFNLSRSVIHLQKVGAGPDLIKVMMRHTKNNFGALHSDIALKILFDKKAGTIKIRKCDMQADPEFRGRMSAADQITLSLTNEGDADTKLLSERTVLPEKTIANRLPRLEKEGVVRVVKKSGRKQIWGIVKAKEKAS